MGFIKKTLDLEKLAQSLRARPGDTVQGRSSSNTGAYVELTPVMLHVFYQALSNEEINIRELNFADIDMEDISGLENALDAITYHSLFALGEKFRGFTPISAAVRVFI